MEEQELTRQYRELDRDLALFYYQIGKYSEENRKIRQLFIPNAGNMEAAEETWGCLRNRVTALPAPDGVYLLLKHHFEDFLDSLAYTLQDAKRHPESSYLNLDSILEGTARCNRQPDEERLEEMLLLLRQLRQENPDIEKSIFRSLHNLALDTFPGYKSDGTEHSFLERFNRTE